MAKTKTTDEGAATAEQQSFIANWRIDHDGETFLEGEPISVDRVTYDKLKAAGAIAGDWKE